MSHGTLAGAEARKDVWIESPPERNRRPGQKGRVSSPFQRLRLRETTRPAAIVRAPNRNGPHCERTSASHQPWFTTQKSHHDYYVKDAVLLHRRPRALLSACLLNRHHQLENGAGPPKALNLQAFWQPNQCEWARYS
jgi:hypothetical protein